MFPQKCVISLMPDKIFFVATAAADSCVNVSPKGLDSPRLLDQQRVIWLNLAVERVQTSCGMSVPLYEYSADQPADKYCQ